MAFSSRGTGSSNPWQDRTLQNSANKTKRKITDSSNNSQVVDFVKNEGKSYNTGTPFNASNMKNLEDRIAQGFTNLNNRISPAVILDRFYPIGIIYPTFDSTNPANILGGGTWTLLNGNGALLMCGDGMPDRMISGNNINYQMTPDYNNQTLNLSTSMEVTGVVGTGYAELPGHSHFHYDRYVPTNTTTHKCSTYYVDGDNSKGNYIRYNRGTNPPISTDPAGTGGGHSHGFTVTANSKSASLESIGVNIEKPAVTLYLWVRTA